MNRNSKGLLTVADVEANDALNGVLDTTARFIGPAHKVEMGMALLRSAATEIEVAMSKMARSRIHLARRAQDEELSEALVELVQLDPDERRRAMAFVRSELVGRRAV